MAQFCAMSLLLSGIYGFCGQATLPGLRLLRYLPTAWLADGEYEEIISPGYNFQKGINPSLGAAAWLTLPFFPKGGDGWQERHRKGEQGDLYEQEVEGIIPMLRAEVAGEFERMSHHLFLAQVTDRNGKAFLVGRQNEPLEFFATADTSNRTGGLASYKFRFAGQTSKRAYGYAPVF